MQHRPKTVLVHFQLERTYDGNSVYTCMPSPVRLSVTRVDQSKTVKIRVMQFSPYNSPIPLVFAA